MNLTVLVFLFYQMFDSLPNLGLIANFGMAAYDLLAAAMQEVFLGFLGLEGDSYLSIFSLQKNRPFILFHHRPCRDYLLFAAIFANMQRSSKI